MNTQSIVKKISRSKVDLYSECNRCFHLDRKLGVARPKGFPLTLNIAVDRLLKNEFDHYRQLKQPHPCMVTAGLDLLPLQHPQLDIWRENFKGVEAEYKGMTFTGAVDDLWADKHGKIYVVDYKATAKSDGPVKELDKESFHSNYIRQLEFYQWLLLQNGLNVSDTGYIVYATGNSGSQQFNHMLQFELAVIPVICEHSWVEPTLDELLNCLHSGNIPAPSPECAYCDYVKRYEQAGSVPKQPL